LLAGLAALVVAVLLAELGLRLFGYDPLPDLIGPRHLFVRDAQLGVRLQPGFRGQHRSHEFEVEIAVNSLGLRDSEPGPGDREALRILSLGDSFAYGFGVEAEETYAEELERLLSAKRATCVYNAGAPSYGTRHELELARRLLPELEPELVLLSFFFGNDLYDNILPPMTERGGIVLTRYFGDAVDASALKGFALEHSQLLTFLILGWMQWVDGVELPAPPTRAPADPELVIETPTCPQALARAVPEDIERAWQETASLVEELRDTAQQAGARLVLLHLPLRYQIDDELWQRMCERHGYADPEADYDRGATAKRLGAVAAELGIPILDLAHAFAEEEDLAGLYFPINKHFSAQGHAVAGRAIAAFLEREGLL
jgi:lysophospholipase L1-like esterase